MKWTSSGAVLATVFWLLASIGFSFYTRTSASTTRPTATAGAVIILLFWLYISAFIILVGAELNGQLEPDPQGHHHRPREADGERDAFAADKVADAPEAKKKRWTGGNEEGPPGSRWPFVMFGAALRAQEDRVGAERLVADDIAGVRGGDVVAAVDDERDVPRRPGDVARLRVAHHRQARAQGAAGPRERLAACPPGRPDQAGAVVGVRAGGTVSVGLAELGPGERDGRPAPPPTGGILTSPGAGLGPYSWLEVRRTRAARSRARSSATSRSVLATTFSTLSFLAFSSASCAASDFSVRARSADEVSSVCPMTRYCTISSSLRCAMTSRTSMPWMALAGSPSSTAAILRRRALHVGGDADPVHLGLEEAVAGLGLLDLGLQPGQLAAGGVELLLFGVVLVDDDVGLGVLLLEPISEAGEVIWHRRGLPDADGEGAGGQDQAQREMARASDRSGRQAVISPSCSAGAERNVVAVQSVPGGHWPRLGFLGPAGRPARGYGSDRMKRCVLLLPYSARCRKRPRVPRDWTASGRIVPNLAGPAWVSVVHRTA